MHHSISTDSFIIDVPIYLSIYIIKIRTIDPLKSYSGIPIFNPSRSLSCDKRLAIIIIIYVIEQRQNGITKMHSFERFKNLCCQRIHILNYGSVTMTVVVSIVLELSSSDLEALAPALTLKFSDYSRST